MEFYPKETLILEETLIRRDRSLPPEAVGNVAVRRGEAVNPRKVVARGELRQDVQIIDVAKIYDLDPRKEKDKDKLTLLIAVQEDETVKEGQHLVHIRGRRERKKAPVAQADGRVSLIEDGRIILQINPDVIEIHARMTGTVTDLIGNVGARIETIGALAQCAWGNGKFGFGGFAFEPEEGLASYLGRDTLLDNLRGRVFILQRPLTVQDFDVALKLRIDGLVAPSMPYYLQEVALHMPIPIMLTDGFGERRASERIFKLLRRHEKQRQAAFDAHTPNRWQNDRPEIIIPLGNTTNSAPPPPSMHKAAKVGAAVRIKRAPYQGVFGQIADLPDSPETIDNGLHTLVARVKLEGGEMLTIPLNNLELLGK